MTPDGGQIDALIAEILKRDEFRQLKESGAETQALGELFDSLFRAMQALVGSLSADHPWAFVLIMCGGAAILGALVLWGARGAARRSYGYARAEQPVLEIIRGDPRQLRKDAAVLAAEGAWLDATRLVFRAAIIEQALLEGTLDRARDAQAFRRARTYRELVDEFSRSPAHSARLRLVAEKLERGLYAGFALSREDFELARSLTPGRSEA